MPSAEARQLLFEGRSEAEIVNSLLAPALDPLRLELPGDYSALEAHLEGLLTMIDQLDVELREQQYSVAQDLMNKRASLTQQSEVTSTQIEGFKDVIQVLADQVAEIARVATAGPEATQLMTNGKNIQTATFLLQLFNEFLLVRLVGGVALQMEMAPVARGVGVIVQHSAYAQALASDTLFKTASNENPEFPAAITYYHPEALCVGISPERADMLGKPGYTSPMGFTPTPFDRNAHTETGLALEYLEQNTTACSVYEYSPFLPPSVRYLLASPFTRHQMLLALKLLISAFDIHNTLSIPRADCLTQNADLPWSLFSHPQVRERLPLPLSSEYLNLATEQTLELLRALYNSITSVSSILPLPPVHCLAKRLFELEAAAKQIQTANAGKGLELSDARRIYKRYGIYMSDAPTFFDYTSRMPADSQENYVFGSFCHRHGLLYELCLALAPRKPPNLLKARRIIMTMDLLGLGSYDLVFETIAYTCMRSNRDVLDSFLGSPLLKTLEDIPDVCAGFGCTQTLSATSPGGGTDIPSQTTVSTQNWLDDIAIRAKDAFPMLSQYFTQVFQLARGLFCVCVMTLRDPRQLILQLTQFLLRQLVQDITELLAAACEQFGGNEAQVSLFLVRIQPIIKCYIEEMVVKLSMIDFAALTEEFDANKIWVKQYPLVYGQDFRFSCLAEGGLSFNNQLEEVIADAISASQASLTRTAGAGVGGFNPQLLAPIFAPFGGNTSKRRSGQTSSAANSVDSFFSGRGGPNIIQAMLYPVSDVRTGNSYSWSFYFGASDEFDEIDWKFDEYFVEHYLKDNPTRASQFSDLGEDLKRRKELFQKIRELYTHLCAIYRCVLGTPLTKGAPKSQSEPLEIDFDALTLSPTDLRDTFSRMTLTLKSIDQYRAPIYTQETTAMIQAQFKYAIVVPNHTVAGFVPMLPAFMSVPLFLNRMRFDGTDNISLLDLLQSFEQRQHEYIEGMNRCSNASISRTIRKFIPEYYGASDIRALTTYIVMNSPWPFMDKTLGNPTGDGMDSSSVLTENSPSLFTGQALATSIGEQLRRGLTDEVDYTVRQLFADYYQNESTYLTHHLSQSTPLPFLQSPHAAVDQLIQSSCPKGVSRTMYSSTSIIVYVERMRGVIHRTRYMYTKMNTLLDKTVGQSFYNYRGQTFQNVQALLIRQLVETLSARFESCVHDLAQMCLEASDGTITDTVIRHLAGDLGRATGMYEVPRLITCPPGVVAADSLNKEGKLTTAWTRYATALAIPYGLEGTISSSQQLLVQYRIRSNGCPIGFGAGTGPIEGSCFILEKEPTDPYNNSVAQSASFAAISQGLYMPLSDLCFEIFNATLQGLECFVSVLRNDVGAFHANEEVEQLITREINSLDRAVENVLDNLLLFFVELTTSGCRYLLNRYRLRSYALSDGQEAPPTIVTTNFLQFCKYLQTDKTPTMLNPSTGAPIHTTYLAELLTNQITILKAGPYPSRSVELVATRVICSFIRTYIAHLSRLQIAPKDIISVIAEIRILTDTLDGIIDTFESTQAQAAMREDLVLLELSKMILVTPVLSFDADLTHTIRKHMKRYKDEILLLTQVLARIHSGGLSFINQGQQTVRSDHYKDSSFSSAIDALFRAIMSE
ncbi:hypothetical protein GMRT_10281 [Giardia muris]|uniref:Uncharacterized protein n=1 Tax=Giardia muris TaxID=5742 RepID=A0A4Z1T8G8_GIAMU|nr:hypothetical protein GMRT_10281 [Giardia muris]|eukprot:TNJ29427.1 hypothetical protein GMRT_10281 [Giardia muris]